MKVVVFRSGGLHRWIKTHDLKITFRRKIYKENHWLDRPSQDRTFGIMWRSIKEEYNIIRELFGVNSTTFWIEKSKIVWWLDERYLFSSRNGSYH